MYIYYGSSEGFTNYNSYRIAPSDFQMHVPNTIIKGFGLGLSNGNDIDNNGHNGKKHFI